MGLNQGLSVMDFKRDVFRVVLALE
jgi:hypothetical protein